MAYNASKSAVGKLSQDFGTKRLVLRSLCKDSYYGGIHLYYKYCPAATKSGQHPTSTIIILGVGAAKKPYQR